MNQNQIQLFTSADGKISLEVSLENETTWLSLEQMAALFGRDRSVISRHLSNLFAEGSWSEKQLLQNL